MKRKNIFKRKLMPLHLACGDDSLRPAFMNIYVDNGIASATNMHIAVRVKLADHTDIPQEEIDLLNGKFMPAKMWQEMVKADSFKVEENGVKMTHKGVVSKMYFTENVQRFPNMDQAIPKGALVDISQISFRPHLSAILAKIFANQDLIFQFRGANKAIVIRPSGVKAFYAIQAPVMIQDAQETELF